MKNITDPAIRYIRKIISANLYWYGRSPFENDNVRESVVSRIVTAINAKYRLVERAEDDKESE